jgi:formiminotetrahydrofolate cyclodeaminase
MYNKGSIRDYLKDLSARLPSPGGGSAAALGAAIGAGLMCMVANYTAGNPKYKDVWCKASEILAKSEKLRDGFERLIDEDVAAYKKLSEAMKNYPKDAARLDAAYKEALKPPFEACSMAHEALKLCAELVDCGNKNLITDTAIAAIMLEGAFFSAKFNVYINLKYIKDIDYVGGIHKVLAPLEAEMPKLKEDILEKCEDAISK